MERKYEILKENSINYKGKTLYRIRALKSFGFVRAGDVGGYIEGEHNLSQYGNCWVSHNAMVFDNAFVCENAVIYHNAQIYGNALIKEDARVLGFVHIYENACISGRATIEGIARVFGSACIEGEAFVGGDACIYDNAIVHDSARIYGGRVFGNAHVEYHAIIVDDARVYGSAWIRYGVLNCDIRSNLKKLIACSLNVYPNPVTNTYILYKRVKKIKDGVYCSLFNRNFIYRDGEIVEIDDYDPNFLVSCSSGLHVSTPFYWQETDVSWSSGNVLIAVEVHLNDIITCMEGKIRCKRLKVLGEVKGV